MFIADRVGFATLRHFAEQVPCLSTPITMKAHAKPQRRQDGWLFLAPLRLGVSLFSVINWGFGSHGAAVATDGAYPANFRITETV